jgi:hypothetical protein
MAQKKVREPDFREEREQAGKPKVVYETRLRDQASSVYRTTRFERIGKNALQAANAYDRYDTFRRTGRLR